jgi:hypothetical protein
MTKLLSTVALTVVLMLTGEVHSPSEQFREGKSRRWQRSSEKALEARSGKIGFVIFEGPARLLDWGVFGCTELTSRLREVVAKRVRPLLFRHQLPS